MGAGIFTCTLILGMILFLYILSKITSIIDKKTLKENEKYFKENLIQLYLGESIVKDNLKISLEKQSSRTSTYKQIINCDNYLKIQENGKGKGKKIAVSGSAFFRSKINFRDPKRCNVNKVKDFLQTFPIFKTKVQFIAYDNELYIVKWIKNTWREVPWHLSFFCVSFSSLHIIKTS